MQVAGERVPEGEAVTVLLETVIASIESADRPYAIRAEPGLLDAPPTWVRGTFGTIAKVNGCTTWTAQVIASTSYGLFQILGAVLYGDLKFPNPISFFHYDAEQQVTQFRALVRHWGFDPAGFDFTDDELLVTFAARYNGPGAIPAYVAKMKAAYAALPK